MDAISCEAWPDGRGADAAPSGAACGPRTEARQTPGVRRTIRFGAAHADFHEFAAERPLQLRLGATCVGLLVALAGELAIVSRSGRATARREAAVFLARNEPVTVVGDAGARLLAVYLTRARLHALASAAYGGGRRVSTAAPWTLAFGAADALATALTELVAPGDAGPPEPGLSERLHHAVLDAMVRCGPLDEMLPLSRAVTEAMRRVRERPDEDWTVGRLALAAGVTPKYLQHRFRDHLGKGVGAFILETRLDRARESLSTTLDSRPLSAIARSLGFQKPGSFSRAYIRRFGEPPSETRSRAVRARSD